MDIASAAIKVGIKEFDCAATDNLKLKLKREKPRSFLVLRSCCHGFERDSI